VEFRDLAPGDPGLTEVYPVLKELRTHLSESVFFALYEEGYQEGYRVVGLFHEGECRAVAGYHLSHGFMHGRFMYIDDLVTADRYRSHGYGSALNDYLLEKAKHAGCSSVQLDSGTQRTDAHRFYFRDGYVITSFHFLHKL
jgi:GNAT superfamily N-acetyltransferase